MFFSVSCICCTVQVYIELIWPHLQIKIPFDGVVGEQDEELPPLSVNFVYMFTIVKKTNRAAECAINTTKTLPFPLQLSDPHLDEEIPSNGIWPHSKDISTQTSACLLLQSRHSAPTLRCPCWPHAVTATTNESLLPFTDDRRWILLGQSLTGPESVMSLL